MADKSPGRVMKKPELTIKERRAAKREKLESKEPVSRRKRPERG